MEEKSPEYEAGLRKGDVIVRLNGKKFHCTWTGFVKDILFTIDKVTLDVERDGKVFPVTYLPAPNPKHQVDEEIAYPFFKPYIPIQVYPRKNSAAEKLGLKDNDRIIAANNIEIKNVPHFHNILFAVQGKEITLTVERAGKLLTLTGKSGTLVIPPGKDKPEGSWKLGFAGNPVMDVLPALPFDKAGIKEGDKILAFNNTPIVTMKDALKFMEKNQGNKVEVKAVRNGREMLFSVQPLLMYDYRFGASFAVKEHPTPWQQFTDVIDSTIRSMRGIGISIGKKLHLTDKHTTIKPKHMSGPIGIGRVLFLSVYLASIMQGLVLVVMITFSLGLLNLLPIPVLDGGHILLALIELVLRKPIPQKLLDPISYAFIAILIFFMLFVTFYDVRRIVNPIVRSYKKKAPAKVEKIEKKDIKNASPTSAEQVKAN